MNLKIGFMFLIYYSVVSLLFLVAGSPIATDPGYTSNIYLNDTALGSSEVDTGGLFGTGVSFGRFFIFITFGIGLPADTPGFMSIIFFLWQTAMTILAVMWVISSIWNG